MASRSAQDELATIKALLNLREHDVDRLHAEHAAFLLLLTFLLAAGRIEVARDAIGKRLT
ncbi:hypothetical protein [Rhizobium sp. Root1220]|uniref:hypothetical protein n=1 Tax=Rhizobium sp. Root1220 TaxID=1736432 RepID=UPI0006FE1C02|nr:hypothetical protein [Rhizobium sp. Root1220]KQV68045.1 hypothetical protein ASC90_10300 [Rhizobium sp. Root1220]